MKEEKVEITQIETVPNVDKWYTPLTRVTPLSRALALVLFVILPFMGFWLGIRYGESQIAPTVIRVSNGVPASSPSSVERSSFVEKDDNPKNVSQSCSPRSDEVRVYTDSAGTVDASAVFENPLRANLSAIPIEVRADVFVLVEVFDGRGLRLGERYIRSLEWRCANDKRVPYRLEAIETGVKLVDDATDEAIQTIFLKDIPINNPKTSFHEVYGSESAKRLEDNDSILTNFDVNFDGYNDLGILIDTGPKEVGYVFYIFDESTNRLVPAQLEGETPNVFVVYAPSVNTRQKVLKGTFSVSNPRHVQYFTYRYDDSRGVFSEEIEE